MPRATCIASIASEETGGADLTKLHSEVLFLYSFITLEKNSKEAESIRWSFKEVNSDVDSNVKEL